ncbi:MAG: hypothetical protein JXA13_14060 [Anaerolineales bacterium]|nr:hypothetical protein [Anaerolineales bacterium]
MDNKKRFALLGALALAAIALAACAGPAGPPGPPGPAGEQGSPGPPAESVDLTCSDCHNSTATITSKQTSWAKSGHGSGDAYVRGSISSCAGCHSGGAFASMVADGKTRDQIETGDPEPTRQDCRTCHQIHTTYTGEDWALKTIDPVTILTSGDTFDGGKGNLCANCHQPLSGYPEAVDGLVEVVDHWGPHHGPQAAIMVGVGGASEGTLGGHTAMVEDTCVTCHLANHAFEPSLNACLECHEGAENFDINGAQAEVQTQLDELEAALIAKGMLDEEGEPVLDSYPEAEAAALWNWITITEDRSSGVHNPNYTKALLETSLEAVK